MTQPVVDIIGPEATDPADTTGLSAAIRRLLPALERFNRHEGAELAAKNREIWQERLNRSLPAKGAGLNEVLDELAEVVIPHGLRNGAPGFNGWVTTAP